MRRTKRAESGFTFSELMIAVAIIVTATFVLIGQLAMSYRTTRAQKDRVFAFSIAKSILDEIHALSQAGGANETEIDLLDDAVSTNPTLSITTQSGSLIATDHELSGNIQRDGQWVWSRQISVQPLPGLDNRKLRQITVRVLKRDGSRVDEVVALSSVVNSIAKSNSTTQVFDVFFIAVESIPGWWVHMESIRAFMQAVVADLERSNPGLRVRSHWITKASYGRNQVYRPYINTTVDSHTDIPEVYFYPGLMPSGNATTNYYVPSLIHARYVNESEEVNGYDWDVNPYPYALSDFFNHGMRLPRERAFHEVRVAAVKARADAILQAEISATTAPVPYTDMSEEPTYRLLLEDMATDPDKYRNALVVNLHGELCPMPSIRNYSDAAKVPAVLPEVRVVTHPEELRTQRPGSGGPDTEDVKLRVYGYATDPGTYAGPLVMPTVNPIAIQVMDLDLSDGAGGLLGGVTIENLRGGVPVGGTDEYFPLAASKVTGDVTLVADEMYYDIAFVDPGTGLRKYTLLKLYHTPVVSPPVVDSLAPTETRGLFADLRSRLYNMEYVPAPTEAGLDFSRNLYESGDGPKNTARWVITVPGSVFTGARWVTIESPPTYYDPNSTGSPDRTLTVRTRIWDPSLTDPLESGTWPAGLETRVIQPENLSETYTWWAGTPEAVPITERSQFLGDPRHNPYKDLATGSLDFPDGYNWYFDSLVNNTEDSATDYPGIDNARLRNRWDARASQDVPRFLQLLRAAIVESGSTFSSLVGYSFYYMGHGNDVGYDSNNGYPSSIPIDLRPLGSPGSDGFMNTINGGRRYVRGDAAPYWWSMPWLGELCPDSVHATQWLALDGDGNVRGNLAAGTSAGEFYQEDCATVYTGSSRIAYGTALLSGTQQTNRDGCTAFFNIGSSGSTFHHESGSSSGTLVGSGIEIATSYNTELPTSTPINRPFGLTLSGTVADEWSFSPYDTGRHTASLRRTYYDYDATRVGSALIELVNPGNTSAGFVVPNGLSESGTTGTSLLAKYSLLTVIHSHFEAGEPTWPHRVTMVPRVKIIDPTEITELNDPATVDILFDVEWLRWDGAKYAAAFPSGFTEPESDLEYVILYSINGGQTWRYVQDDSTALPGVLPDSTTYRLNDLGAGQETYSWATPAGSMPRGSYEIRVEAYKSNRPLHYAFHQRKVYIER